MSSVTSFSSTSLPTDLRIKTLEMVLAANPATILDVGPFADLGATSRRLYGDTVTLDGVGPVRPDDHETYDTFYESNVLDFTPSRRYDLIFFPTPSAIHGVIEDMVKHIRKQCWRMLLFTEPNGWTPIELSRTIGSSLAVRQNPDGHMVFLF